MVNVSKFFVKAHPQIAGRWPTNAFWDKFAQAKKAVKDAYQRAIGKAVPEAQVEQVVAPSQLSHTISKRPSFQQILLNFNPYFQGYARAQQRIFSRPGMWGRGGGHFGKDFLWRRLRTGHLVGFATLFLVHEEKNKEEDGFRKRMETYGSLCENIKDIFHPGETEREDTGEYSKYGKKISDFKLGNCIAVGSNGAVYEAEVNEQTHDESSPKVLRVGSKPRRKQHVREPVKARTKAKKVAVKMVFNFDSSNTGAICRQTQSELVTCGRGAIVGLAKDWQNGCRTKMKILPPHSNIIRVHRAMIDKVPYHPDFEKMHPAILPQPAGFGRSLAMFIVMKRYDRTLRDLLKSPLHPSIRFILSLQLLQGISHLERNNVAHRDLKSDNILIEQDSAKLPRLVLADFGCALVPGPDEDLSHPFLSPMYDIRNGNPEVQPPEITNAQPGPNSVLDYTKADAWGAGILLCEIMGIKKNQLHRAVSGENDEMRFCKQLIRMLLIEDPAKRISCSAAARVLHLQLFGPKFEKGESSRMSRDVNAVDEIVQKWLLLHASETLAYRSTAWGKKSVVRELFSNFLSTLSFSSLSSAFSLWQSLST